MFRTLIFVFNLLACCLSVDVCKRKWEMSFNYAKTCFPLFYWPQNSIHTKRELVLFFYLFHIAHNGALKYIKCLHFIADSFLLLLLFLQNHIIMFPVLSTDMHVHLAFFFFTSLTLPMTQYPLMQDNESLLYSISHIVTLNCILLLLLMPLLMMVIKRKIPFIGILTH